jgi:hypothetical protein
MALLDQQMLKRVPVRELVHKKYTKPALSPHVAAMTTHFNNVSQWTATTILSETSAVKRGNLVKQFIYAATVRHTHEFKLNFMITFFFLSLHYRRITGILCIITSSTLILRLFLCFGSFCIEVLFINLIRMMRNN